MYDMKNLIHIFTILECIEKSWIYTQDFDDPTKFIWANDQKELNAVISIFIAMGEESKKIDVTLKNSVDLDLSWSDIAGLRDKISHNYRGVDAEILWAVITNDLEKLKDALILMVEKIDPPRELLKEFISTPHYKHIQYLLDTKSEKE